MYTCNVLYYKRLNHDVHEVHEELNMKLPVLHVLNGNYFSGKYWISSMNNEDIKP